MGLPTKIGWSGRDMVLASQSATITAAAAVPAVTSVQEATADANTQTGAYVQADVQSIRTLVNSLKAKYNTAQADIAALRATNQDLKTQLNAVIAAMQAAGLMT